MCDHADMMYDACIYSLDIFFMKNQRIALSIQGDAPIHVTGYQTLLESVSMCLCVCVCDADADADAVVDADTDADADADTDAGQHVAYHLCC